MTGERVERGSYNQRLELKTKLRQPRKRENHEGTQGLSLEEEGQGIFRHVVQDTHIASQSKEVEQAA